MKRLIVFLAVLSGIAMLMLSTLGFRADAGAIHFMRWASWWLAGASVIALVVIGIRIGLDSLPAAFGTASAMFWLVIHPDLDTWFRVAAAFATSFVIVEFIHAGRFFSRSQCFAAFMAGTLAFLAAAIGPISAYHLEPHESFAPIFMLQTAVFVVALVWARRRSFDFFWISQEILDRIWPRRRSR